MIEYSPSRTIDRHQFVDLLQRSTLAERRPVDDAECVESMLRHADLTVTACQGEGVGRRLMQVTRERLGPRCKLILLSAPGAASYYPHVGFEQHPSAWVLHEDHQIR